MRRAIRLTKEATAGTFDASALTANILYPRLVNDNGFVGRPMPNHYTVRDAAGSNRPVQIDYGTKTAVAKMETLLYPSQAKVILSPFCNLVADGIDFKPAYTFTIDEVEQLEDTGRTKVYARYLGNVPQELTLRSNNQGDGQKFSVSASWLYTGYSDTITITDFATPTLASFPSENPYKFQQLSGGLSIDSSVVASFKSFELSVKNILSADYDESVYPQAIHWCGRDVSFKADLRWKSQAHRTAFDGVTHRAVTVAITDGTNTCTFDFKGQNVITALAESTPLGASFYQMLTSTALVDGTAGTDFAFTFAP